MIAVVLGGRIDDSGTKGAEEGKINRSGLRC
jgi:hypothetical protein